ncbi:hypothetical protein GYMLUDRAFT_486395 [Collybiopsis luxurians FD-317 M1]|uniref:Fruit-body specific protein a n=1 Tax=Collybiopsis luxurians FD-317 M1 TaxID=944289 RepID=A0A0D0C501_9AGAR|nr:hypothetical protein GYMLUDRAFT_486395 [Collybiopsis luxurians FD-317 M1]
MLFLTRLLAFSTLAVSVAECGLVYPAYQGVPATTNDAYNFNGTSTNSDSITSTALQVDQKSGVTTELLPNLPPANTTVTAVDGSLLNATIPASRRTVALPLKRKVSRRSSSEYELVFWGTGTDSDDRDASIVGTAYLTYTLVNNSTYNIQDCLEFCDNTPGCVFVNLYYEMNNHLLDHVFSEHSNLKCATYGDIHTAQEKLNFGGQSLSGDPNGPLTYIQQSAGWSSKSLSDPFTPDGYDPLAPLDGANEAPGYMGFVFLSKYDVAACAAECNARDPDPVGGSCKYFNIWRATVYGVPTTYTCAMYYIPADPSTAINYGQGNLKVTDSRGYVRKSYVLDGGFENLTCPNSGPFCLTTTTDTWLGSSPEGGDYDATIFHYTEYAHSGHGVALLGSAYGEDSLPGTLTSASVLYTEPGKTYIIEFFHSSYYSGGLAERDAFVEVYWNGNRVGALHPGYSLWQYYHFTAVGTGSDKLYFVGGAAPSYDFIDDVSVMQT